MGDHKFNIGLVSVSYQNRAEVLIKALEEYSKLMLPASFDKLITNIQEITDENIIHKETPLDKMDSLKNLIEKAQPILLMNGHNGEKFLSLNIAFTPKRNGLFNQDYSTANMKFSTSIKPESEIFSLCRKIALDFKPIFLYASSPDYFQYDINKRKELNLPIALVLSDPYEFPDFLRWINYWSKDVVSRTPFNYDTDKDLFYHCEILPDGGLIFQVSKGSIDLKDPADLNMLNKIYDRLILPIQ